MHRGAWARAPAPLAVADTDADQLPDAWKTHYFGDLDKTAAGNPDGDAKTNREEYLAGTDPTIG